MKDVSNEIFKTDQLSCGFSSEDGALCSEKEENADTQKDTTAVQFIPQPKPHQIQN